MPNTRLAGIVSCAKLCNDTKSCPLAASLMTPAYACAVLRYFPFLSRHQKSPSSAEQSIVDWRSAQYVEVDLWIYVT
jgi:hypothetical protein